MARNRKTEIKKGMWLDAVYVAMVAFSVLGLAYTLMTK